MNWLLILVILLVAGNMVWGFTNGFVRVLYSMLGWVLVLFLTVWATPQLAEWMEVNAFVQGTLEESFAAFVIALLLSKIILSFAVKALDLIAKLPLLKEANCVLGILAGLVKGLFLTELMFFVVSLGRGTTLGNTLEKLITEAPVLTWLYKNNILTEIVSTFI